MMKVMFTDESDGMIYRVCSRQVKRVPLSECPSQKNLEISYFWDKLVSISLSTSLIPNHDQQVPIERRESGRTAVHCRSKHQGSRSGSNGCEFRTLHGRSWMAIFSFQTDLTALSFEDPFLY